VKQLWELSHSVCDELNGFKKKKKKSIFVLQDWYQCILKIKAEMSRSTPNPELANSLKDKVVVLTGNWAMCINRVITL
jgi:hypothetical protein